MTGRFAHIDGATAFLAATPRDLDDHDDTGLAASLDSWMMMPHEDDPAHTRWKGALQRQRAAAIAQREMDRKRAQLQAIEEAETRQTLVDELRRTQRQKDDLAQREWEVARREEALRETGQSVDQILKRADEGLYAAKNSGRNKVVTV